MYIPRNTSTIYIVDLKLLESNNGVVKMYYIFTFAVCSSGLFPASVIYIQLYFY
jgi:hypothetical protein